MGDICFTELKVRLERDIVAVRCCAAQPTKKCPLCPFRSRSDCLSEKDKQLTIDLALAVQVLENISQR